MSFHQDQFFHSPAFVELQREDLYLLVDPNAPNWIATNRAGARLLRNCDGRHTFVELTQELVELGIARAEAAAAAAAFLQQAQENGFVSTQPQSPLPYPGRAQVIRPGRLSEVWIHTNNNCNLRCTHCLVDAGEADSPQLTTTEIKRLIDDSRTLGAGRFYFTGGEPCLRADLLELIDYVTRSSELVILSNGTLIDESLALRLAQASRGRLLLQVSLEGPNAEVNDAVRGTGAFTRAVAGIEQLVAVGLPPVISSVLSRVNAASLPQLTRLVGELGARFHHIIWLHNRGRATSRIAARPEGDSIWVEAEEVAEVMRRVQSTAAEVGVIVDNEVSLRARVSAKRNRKLDLCNCCFETLCIYSDGRVYPCPALAGEPDFDCGSTKEQPLADLWLNSPRMEWVRSASVQLRVDCAHCRLKFFCGGGCLTQAYLDHKSAHGEGSLLAPDPYCRAYRELLEDELFKLAMQGKNGQDPRLPHIYAAMGNELPACASAGTIITDAAFEVGAFHCACVLATEAEEGGCCAGQKGAAAIQASVSRYYAARSQKADPKLCCPSGYRPEDLAGLPEEVTNVSYGCGNPVAFDDLKPGETVVDIGSGAGIDCFIAAGKVGEAGRVIGVDMTAEMLAAARANAEQMGAKQVEFRQGTADNLPVESGTADMVMSNCVINLAPDKPAVFREIARVLKCGGRMVVSDIVSDQPVPPQMQEDPELWSQCVSGALTEHEYRAAVKGAGLSRLQVLKRQDWQEVEGLCFYSITLRAVKCGPGGKC